MKSIINSRVLLVFVIATCLFAQHRPILAHSAENVIFIRWLRNNEDQHFSVYRKIGMGDYNRINERPIRLLRHRSEIMSILGNETPEFLAKFKVRYPEQIHLVLDNLPAADIITTSMEPRLAVIRGSGYLDSAVTKGSTYTYRITVTENGTESIYADEINLTAENHLPEVPGIDARGGNEVIRIYLQESKGPCAGYDIYRAEVRTGTYEKRNDRRIFPVARDSENWDQLPAYEDSSVEVGKRYWYKSVGVDVIGNYGIFTEPVSAVAYDSIPPKAPVIDRIVVEPRRVHISWTHPDTVGVVDFHVYRSEDPSGQGSRLKTTKGNSYTDARARTDRVYWYWIGAVDRYGNESFSIRRAVKVTK